MRSRWPGGYAREAIGRDWVQPTDPRAWVRVTEGRIDVVLGEKSLATAEQPATVDAGPKP